MPLLLWIKEGFCQLGFGRQWVLLASLASILSLSVVILPVALKQRDNLLEVLSESSQLNVQWLAQSIAPHLLFQEKTKVEGLLGALEIDPRVLSAVVMKLDQFDGQLYLFAYFSRMDVAPETLRDIRSLQPSDVLEVTEPIKLDYQNIGQIKLFLSNRSVEKLASNSLKWTFIAWVAGILMMMIFTRWIKNYLMRPVVQLDTKMKQLSKNQDYSQRAPVASKDEIGDLAASFNIFLSRLEDNEVHRHNKEREILELNAILEDKVTQRTQELERQITYLQETQTQIVEQEKLASLGGLMAGFTHEVNTPIGISLTLSAHLRDRLELLRQDFESGALTKQQFIELTDDIKEACSKIQSNLDKAAEHIKSFKAFTIDQSNDEARLFNLKYFVTSIINALKPTLKMTAIKIDVIMDEGIEIRSYPIVFSQIVTNLVINSIAHAFEASQPGNIRIAAYFEGDFLVFDYSDDGKGIDPSIKERLFEAFVTTAKERGGSGLGTHIVHSLITRTLGGEVEFTSQPGQGTRFLFRIPKIRLVPETQVS